MIALVHQRDDGRYQVGLADDAAGPFDTRAFAEAIAAHEFARAAWLRRRTRHFPQFNEGARSWAS